MDQKPSVRLTGPLTELLLTPVADASTSSATDAGEEPGPTAPAFAWGTTACSTQTEGAPPASDWAAWERAGRAVPSGDGNGFATRFADDLALLAAHGLTHHRLSIDWARIEPNDGKRDRAAIEHYRSVLLAARAAGVSVWVTLLAGTLPGWFVDAGGLLDDRQRSRRWPRHVDELAQELGDLVHGWVTVEDPIGFAAAGWLEGVRPPGRRDRKGFGLAVRAVMLAHRDAWRELRGGGPLVATAFGLPTVHTADGSVPARQLARRVDASRWGVPVSALRDGMLVIPGRADEDVVDLANSCDVVGFTYDRSVAATVDETLVIYPLGHRQGPLGDGPWDEGLPTVVHRLADELPGRPLMVMGHGVGTADDEWRADVVRAAVDSIAAALADGIDLRGYLHRTAIDGYEWHGGFSVPFGLFDRDRNPRQSAEALARAASTTVH